MKKMTFARWILVPMALMMLISVSCKKRKEFKSEDAQDTMDARTVQGENDAAIGDANTVLADQELLSGKYPSGQKLSKTTGVSICGMTVDTTSVTSGMLLLNFDGTTCNNRKREGQIKLSIVGYPAVKWKNIGAVLKLEYIGYKVTRASDGKNVLINGTVFITNVNGGTWIDIAFLGKANVVHEVTATALKVKYDNGSLTSEYNIQRRYTYTYSNLVFNCKAEGLGTNDGLNNLENWGTTRDGHKFTSQITSPIIWNTTCGGGAPVDGEAVIRVDEKSFEMRCIFAVDASGNEITVAPNACAFGWKAEWKYKNKTRNRVFLYN